MRWRTGTWNGRTRGGKADGDHTEERAAGMPGI